MTNLHIDLQDDIFKINPITSSSMSGLTALRNHSKLCFTYSFDFPCITTKKPTEEKTGCLPSCPRASF